MQFADKSTESVWMNALVDDAYVSGHEPPMLPTVYNAVASVPDGAAVMAVLPNHVQDADTDEMSKNAEMTIADNMIALLVRWSDKRRRIF